MFLREAKLLLFKGLLSVTVVLVIIFFSAIFFKLKEKKLREIGYEPGRINLESTNLEFIQSLITDSQFIVCNGITCYGFHRPEFGVINSYGFRSPEFLYKSNREQHRKCIGLIGDSFTFGMTARPIDSCFADILRNKTGLYIDNLGIEGSGLAEYLRVLSWYVPQFQPDRVYVILSQGDLVNYIKSYNPNYPFQYGTNVGAFPAYDEIGRFCFRNAFESRDYYIEHYTMMKNTSQIEKWAAQSAFGTQLWRKYCWNHLDTINQGLKMKPKSWWYFDKMDSICACYNIPWSIVVIPGRDSPLKTKEAYAKKHKAHFREHDFLFVELERSNYVNGNDFHTNNSGHYKIMQKIENDVNNRL